MTLAMTGTWPIGDASVRQIRLSRGQILEISHSRRSSEHSQERSCGRSNNNLGARDVRIVLTIVLRRNHQNFRITVNRLAECCSTPPILKYDAFTLYARLLFIVLPRPILAIGPKWHQHAEINFQWHTLVVSVG
jgi:hypothetical protein